MGEGKVASLSRAPPFHLQPDAPHLLDVRGVVAAMFGDRKKNSLARGMDAVLMSHPVIANFCGDLRRRTGEVLTRARRPDPVLKKGNR